ncbi:hypothetical protein DN402_33260 [Streptomyces sp. SW4]|nr:hypothetical protein DN402_33260 [Streptomyces sp. SW4]
MTEGQQNPREDELTPLERRLLARTVPRGGYVPRDAVAEPEQMPAEPAGASEPAGVRGEADQVPQPPPQPQPQPEE